MFVTFVVFALIAIAWSFALLRWVFSRSSRAARRGLVITSWVAAVAAIVSIISDLHLIAAARAAPASELGIRMTKRGDWWQLDYSRPGASVTTANELHVPAGVAVDLTWSGVPVPWIDVDHTICVPRGDGRCVLIAQPSATRARFVALWPPMWRDVRVVAESSNRFEAWFRNEARTARTTGGNGPWLFVNSGCAYCHVIRGVSTIASLTAPDLTHFAARRTIAGTRIPIRRGALTGWVVHSRGLKPGSEMPDNALNPLTLHPLITYLESLR